MSFNHYYQNELSALRELGREFSERNPALAPFLGQEGRDPDVERLLEGFAFLTGRLRQKLDDELPELSHSLMHLLWPNYLQAVPAMSMLEFSSKGSIKSKQRLDKGTRIESLPVDGVSCPFRTCYDVDLYPLTVDDVEFSSTGEGGILDLTLALGDGCSLPDMALDRLRLHFHGGRSIADALSMMLCEHLSKCEVQLLDSEAQNLFTTRLSERAIQPVGFGHQENLMEYPLNTFMGYRHLQEYFCYPQKYHFIDINELEWTQQEANPQKLCRYIQFRFHLKKVPLIQFRPKCENFRLYCTPVINLFENDAIPIRLDHSQNEYKLVPSGYEPHQCGVIAVKSVHGWRPGEKGLHRYAPFESFEHTEMDSKCPFYSVRIRPGIHSNRYETWMSFSHHQGDFSSLVSETISLELLCCNQNVASKLSVGQICMPSGGTPEFVHFSNISAVTSCYPPPLNKEVLWQIISNMSLNYQSLTSIEALRVVLKTYDFPSAYDEKSARNTKQMLLGLKGMSFCHQDRIWQGLPVRGVCSTLEIDPSHFVSEGAMYQFASVLNEFFALYASVNSFHQLTIKTTEGSSYSWTPRMGLQPVL